MGSYVADELTNRGYKVVIADGKNTPHLSEEQVFVQCDIKDPWAVEEAVKGTKVVFNFAGFVDIDESIYLPRETMDTFYQIQGTRNGNT